MSPPTLFLGGLALAALFLIFGILISMSLVPGDKGGGGALIILSLVLVGAAALVRTRAIEASYADDPLLTQRPREAPGTSRTLDRI